MVAHFGDKTKKGRSMPILFLHISAFALARVGINLKTNSENLDVLSNDENQEVITILPTKITEEIKAAIKRIFGTNVEEIEAKVANELLVRTSPKYHQPKRESILNIPESFKCRNDESSPKPKDDPPSKKLKCHW